ncbi:MAG: flavin-containing monooxygenase, partial [Bacteroidota bacterium]
MLSKEYPNKPSIAIIGAGCSGLTTLKNMIQANVGEVICFEQNDQIGGNWLFSEKESHSSVCETTHIISSKTMSSFEDFPMPENYPDYPSHQPVWRYFYDYATHFNLFAHIQFNTKVIEAKIQEDERWELTLSTGEIKTFDYLLIANGHHSKPRIPEEFTSFKGELIHSHLYKTNKPFSGKKVLVVGAGNSGCDCAVEISRVAEYTAISVRNPQYISPKFFLGKPTDTFNKGMAWLPTFISNPLRRLAVFI